MESAVHARLTSVQKCRSPKPAVLDRTIQYEGINSKHAELLERAFAFFNDALFESKLPECILVLHRHRGARGYFGSERWNRRGGLAVLHEIALNPESFTGRTDREILSTFVHEMAHLWQQVHGTPSRRAYHNREWADKMHALGLPPSSTGAPGGKETGQRVSHYIREGGPFDRACAEFLGDGQAFLAEAIVPIPIERPKSKFKYSCPSPCAQNAWAKDGAEIACARCGSVMEKEQD